MNNDSENRKEKKPVITCVYIDDINLKKFTINPAEKNILVLKKREYEISN
jgi:hypothetical protein